MDVPLANPDTPYTIVRGAELPDIGFEWRDRKRAIIDFSSGWTFRLVVVAEADHTIVKLDKTAAITGSASAPNVSAAFAVDELEPLAPADYLCDLYAIAVADGRVRGPLRWRLRVRAPLGPTPL